MLETFSSLQAQAYEIIKNKILIDEYHPGTKISEKYLEVDLGIGRTPVREAILRLRRENLIDVIPQSGTYISKINMPDAKAAHFIRENLEVKVVAEAINLADENALEAFKNILTAQKVASNNKNIQSFFDADEQFHAEFYKLTDKTIVWEWLQQVNIHLNRFRWLRLKLAVLDWDILTNQHEALLQALIEHDTDEAVYLTSKHLHLMIDETKALLTAFPDYFS